MILLVTKAENKAKLHLITGPESSKAIALNGSISVDITDVLKQLVSVAEGGEVSLVYSQCQSEAELQAGMAKDGTPFSTMEADAPISEGEPDISLIMSCKRKDGD